MRNEVSLLDNFFGKSLFDKAWFGDMGLNNIMPSMRMDIKETDNDYQVIMDVPGVPKENIKIELEDGYLTVSANVDKKNESKDENEKWIRRERYTSSQSQRLYVGDIKEDDIKASMQDGVLNITIPKSEDAKPKKSTINID